MNNDEIKLLLKKSDKELIEIVLSEDFDASYELGVLGKKETKYKIEEWIKPHLFSLKKRVCGNEKVKNIIETEDQDEIAIITAVADALIGYFTGAAIFTAATLIVRFGLKKLCVESDS